MNNIGTIKGKKKRSLNCEPLPKLLFYLKCYLTSILSKLHMETHHTTATKITTKYYQNKTQNKTKKWELTKKAKQKKTKKQEAHGPQLAHLSETATADMQMACNIFPILLWQGNGLNSFWNILLTRLKCWNFLNVTSKISHPQCLLPTFESTGISVQ